MLTYGLGKLRLVPDGAIVMTALAARGRFSPACLRVRWLPFVAISVAVHAVALLPGAPQDALPPTAATYGSLMSVALAHTPTAAITSETPAQQPLRMQALQPRTPKYPVMLPFPAVAPATQPWDESAYLPRQRLTIAPAALREIDVPYPANAARNETIATRLMLFINEDGSVAEARVVTPFIPPEFAHAARQAFLSATFRPGQVDGVSVKSRMLIEVSFSKAADDSNQH